MKVFSITLAILGLVCFALSALLILGLHWQNNPRGLSLRRLNPAPQLSPGWHNRVIQGYT